MNKIDEKEMDDPCSNCCVVVSMCQSGSEDNKGYGGGEHTGKYNRY